jgi:hypothetical protein
MTSIIKISKGRARKFNIQPFSDYVFGLRFEIPRVSFLLLKRRVCSYPRYYDGMILRVLGVLLYMIRYLREAKLIRLQSGTAPVKRDGL